MTGSLQITSSGAGSRADAAWRGLIALAGSGPRNLTGAQLAAQLAASASASDSSLAVRNLLHDILAGAQHDSGAGSILEEVSTFLGVLEPPILVGVMRADGDARRRVEFFDAASALLSVKTLLRLAAASASAFDRQYPASVRSAIQKLARRAVTLPSPDREQADTVFRDLVQRLFRSWMEPRRAQVSAGFDAAVPLPRRTPGRVVPESDRLLEMAVECDAMGDSVWIALNELLEDGGTARVIALIKAAPEGSSTAAAVMKRIATPNELRALLRAEPFDGAAVDALLRGMGLAAANVLLEELVESTSRLTRRYLMDRLARLGPEIRPLVEGRLRDQRWFVQRNMLALLRSAGCPADLSMAARFLAHKDARVRRDAALWCLETPATRDEALARALGDRDPAVMRPALQAARGQLPTAAVPVLARRVLESDFPPEFRVLAIRLLGRSNSLLALEALLHFVQNGKSLLGRPRLAHKTPEMLAALSGLARSWTAERRAAPLLAQARKSRDRDIAAALRNQNEEGST